MSSRLEQLERREAELEGKRGQLAEKIADLAFREEELRFEAVQKAPTQAPDAIGSPVYRTRRKRLDAEKELELVERNLTPVQRALADERARDADDRFLELVKDAEHFNRDEIAAWEEAGPLFEQLMKIYLRIITTAEERDQFASQGKNLLTPSTDASVRERFESASSPPVTPFPIDYMAFIEMVFNVTVDPFGDGYRDAGGKPSDWQRLLPKLLPDLRGMARHAQLSGHIEKKSSAKRWAEGFQPVGPSGKDAAREAAAGVTEDLLAEVAA